MKQFARITSIPGEEYLSHAAEMELKKPYSRKKNNLGSQIFPIEENPFGKPFAYSVVGPKPKGFNLWETAYEPSNYGVFLHGGPGSTVPSDPPRSFSQQTCVFVPEQRRAHAVPLRENTTWDLVEDIKAMLDHYKVEKAAFYGSSWGGYVGLAFASKYPERIKGLVATCLVTPNVLEWLLSPSFGQRTPMHAHYYGRLKDELGNDIAHYVEILFEKFKAGYDILQSQGESAFLSSPEAKTVKAWLEYSVAIDDERERDLTPELEKIGENLVKQCPRVLLQMHYARNGFFTQPQKSFLHKLEGLRDKVPVTLIFGENDMVTQRGFSADIANAVHAKVIVVEGASHNYTPLFRHGIIEALEAIT